MDLTNKSVRLRDQAAWPFRPYQPGQTTVDWQNEQTISGTFVVVDFTSDNLGDCFHLRGRDGRDWAIPGEHFPENPRWI